MTRCDTWLWRWCYSRCDEWWDVECSGVPMPLTWHGMLCVVKQVVGCGSCDHGQMWWNDAIMQDVTKCGAMLSCETVAVRCIMWQYMRSEMWRGVHGTSRCGTY